jgi:hypothetical protein
MKMVVIERMKMVVMERMKMVVIGRMKIIPKLHPRLQEVRPNFSDTLRYDTV